MIIMGKGDSGVLFKWDDIVIEMVIELGEIKE